MGNTKSLFIFAVSFFVTIGMYVSIPPAYAQEGEEINPKNYLSITALPVTVTMARAPKGHELKTPNLADAKWQASKKDEEILNAITNGKNKMPRWSEKLKPEEIQALAKYVRKLAPKKRE